MASSFWAELLLWIIVFAGIVGGVCACLYRLTTRDSAEYDLEFVWNHRFESKDLNLDPKSRK